MKKVIVILMALIFWVESFGHIIHVGPLHKVKSIRTAIRIANNGDTILVAAGMYKEG
ncbi:MAG: nitrous oxide reductase family maturation protein NosD, partial [Chitinophagia bacterium]|nr:nitrous oxide reductase family maturation protein NosD [Chitinophagia bacterium]